MYVETGYRAQVLMKAKELYITPKEEAAKQANMLRSLAGMRDVEEEEEEHHDHTNCNHDHGISPGP